LEYLELAWTYVGMVEDFFKKFKDQGYISKAAAAGGKQLEI